MKPFIVCFLIMLFAKICIAQNEFVYPPESITPERIWLYNSGEKMLENEDSIVDRSYFYGKWVEIQSEKPWNNNTKYIMVGIPPDSNAYAERFSSQKLTERVLYLLSIAAINTRVKIIAEEQNKETGTKRVGVISFIIKLVAMLADQRFDRQKTKLQTTFKYRTFSNVFHFLILSL